MLRRIYFICTVIVFFPLIILSQEGERTICGTKTPSIIWENIFSDLVFNYKNRNINNTSLSNYTIPIVIHILHDGDDIGNNENISYLKVLEQMTILNEDFSGINSDISNVPLIFQAAKAGNTGIQFCLAKTNPDGDALTEPGVDRINWVERGWYSPSTPFSADAFVQYFDETIKPATIWDPKKYLNIWLSDKNNPLAGYAKFPLNSSLPELQNAIETEITSGVWLFYNYWGTQILISSGRVLTHEVGHYLGVLHTFEDFDNNNQLCYGGDTCAFYGDRCCDTPPQSHETEDFFCPAIYQNSCVESPDTIDMFVNYMDYSNCRIMFTKDQAARMQTTMLNGTYRNTLQNSTACLDCAELVIINQSINPSFTFPGDSVWLSFTEKAKGIISAGNNHIKFYLSEDHLLTPNLNGDIVLDSVFFTGNFPPNSVTATSKKIKIPNNISPGVYYVFFWADATNLVSECVEDNNFASALITISDTVSQIQSSSYKIWYDNLFSSGITYNLTPSINYNIEKIVPTAFIAAGLHTINFQLRKDSSLSSISSVFFYKAPTTYIHTNGRYEYWTNNNYVSKTTVSNNSNGILILADSLFINSLPNGLHTLHIRFKPDGKHWSSVVSSFFYKTDVSPSGNAEYEYWFDNNFASRSTIANISTSNFILLDSIITNGVSNGLHTLHFRFRPDGKTWSSITSSFFYKDQNSITGINNLAKYVYWFDYNWQNPQTITITGVQNLNWTLNTNVDSLSNGPHVLSQAFKDDKGQWSSIISSDFNKQPASTPLCMTSERQFTSGIIAGSGTSYQWQLDSGSGFTDIGNNAVYSGANQDTLQITNAPSSWYGYKFRCRVTNSSNILYGPVYTLKFVSTWTGNIDNTWENPANWSCGSIPDYNTDVFVNSGLSRYPQVNSTTATCRSLNLQPGTSFEVKPGFKIDITGKN